MKFIEMVSVARSQGFNNKLFWNSVPKNNIFIFNDTLPDRQCPEADIDSPFEVYSFETFGDKYLTHGGGIEVSCLMCVETSPKEVSFFVFGIDTETRSKHVVDVSHHKEMMGPVVASILSEISSGKLGVERKRLKFKLKNKKFHKINKVIHIGNKKSMAAASKHCIIDWSHRFEVRGHWRAVKGIGKDRSGDIINNGYTWVNSFIKGGKDLPLVKKVRII